MLDYNVVCYSSSSEGGGGIKKVDDSCYSRMDIKPLPNGHLIGMSKERDLEKFVKERSKRKAEAYEKVRKMFFC